MSEAYRQQLIASPKTVFQDETAMHADLQNDETAGGTFSQMVAHAGYMVFVKGWPIEFTMIRTGHHDDVVPGTSGVGTHWLGWAYDCWPLASNTPGDYLDAGDPRFEQFLKDAAGAPYLFQIGLAGSADTETNRAAAGTTVFSDDGPDHVHFGTQP
jgi:hypothetical protein